MPQRAEGRLAWITGAGSGMGRAAATALAADGWSLALSGRRADALELTATEVRDLGATALTLPLDVADGAAVRAAAAAIADRFGRLDALVAAAGVNVPHRRWEDQSIDEVAQVVDTNLIGVVRTIDAALPALRAARGSIVVVGSYSGWTFAPGAGVAYSASKTALGALCRTVNAEEAEHGVRACHLCPGDVATDLLNLRPAVPDAAARARMLQPEQIGEVVRFVLGQPPHVRIDELVITPLAQG